MTSFNCPSDRPTVRSTGSALITHSLHPNFCHRSPPLSTGTALILRTLCLIRRSRQRLFRFYISCHFCFISFLCFLCLIIHDAHVVSTCQPPSPPPWLFSFPPIRPRRIIHTFKPYGLGTRLTTIRANQIRPPPPNHPRPPRNPRRALTPASPSKPLPQQRPPASLTPAPDSSRDPHHQAHHRLGHRIARSSPGRSTRFRERGRDGCGGGNGTGGLGRRVSEPASGIPGPGAGACEGAAGDGREGG